MASRPPTSHSSSAEVALADDAHPVQRVRQALEVPLVGVLAGEVGVDDDVDLLVEECADRLGQVLVVEDLVALGVDRLALLVDHVVELDDALADVEVEALDAALRRLDRARDQARLDGDVVLEAEPLHELGDALRGEPLHEVVVERQVEARRARVALAPGAAAQLVVDPARVVALGADDVEAAGVDHADVVLLGDGLRLRQGRVVGRGVHLGRVQAALVEQLRGEAGGVAAQQDVGAAAGHVGGDGDGAGAPGLGDDARFLLVELGVERLVLDAAPPEHRREDLGLLDADRADQDGPPRLLHLHDLLDQRVELRLLVAEDQVRLVLADHVAVGRDARRPRACRSCGTPRPRSSPCRSCRTACRRGGSSSGT